MSAEELQAKLGLYLPEKYVPWKPTPHQAAFLLVPHKEAFYGGSTGGGKMVYTNSPVLTPSGWTTHGELGVGDQVFDHDGNPTTVVALSGIQYTGTYKVTMTDGEEILAHKDHLWNVATQKDRDSYQRADPAWKAARRANRPSRARDRSESLAEGETQGDLRGRSEGTSESAKHNNSKRAARARELLETPYIWDYTRTVTTEELIPLGHSERSKLGIPCGGPIRGTQEWKSDIPPYTLGIWLGGGISTSNTRHICAGEDDAPTLEKELIQDGWEVVLWDTQLKPTGKYVHYYRLSHPVKGSFSDILKKEGFYSNKHVPSWVINTSFSDRQAFLGGFCDTDGYVDGRGRIQFCLAREDMVQDVHAIFWSMGLRPTSVKHKKTSNQDPNFSGDAWRFDVSQCPEYIFRFPRKRDRLREATKGKRQYTQYRYIKSVEKVEDVPMQCIQVDNPRNLYRIGRTNLVTHNSIALLMAALQYVEHPKYNALILRRTFKDLSQPGALIDIAMEWLKPTDAVWNAQDKKWKFPSGAVLQFGHMESESDKTNYQGAQYQFCTEVGTKVRMVDGTYKTVECIKAGDIVQTASGPKKVKRTMPPRWADTVRCSTAYGSQVQTTNHKILTTIGWVSYDDLCQSESSSPIQYLDAGISSEQAYSPYHNSGEVHESLLTGPGRSIEQFSELRGHPQKMESYAYSVDGQTYSVESGGGFQENLPLPSWYVLARLHEPGLLSGEHSYLLHNCEAVYGSIGYELPDSQGDCLSCSGLCGAQSPKNTDTYLEYLRPPDGVDGYIQTDLLGGALGNVQERTQAASSYDHPYTKVDLQASVPFVDAPCVMTPVGKRQVVDLTVSDVSNYITFGGLVNMNCGFDELTHFTEPMYTYLFSRMRKQQDNNIPMRMRAAGNPGGLGHEWVKRRFIDPADPETMTESEMERKANRIFIPSGLKDNPYLNQEDYEESMMELDPVTRAQLMNGDWDISADGNMFKKDWFDNRIISEIPRDVQLSRKTRYWDLASTDEAKAIKEKGDADYTASVLAALGTDGNVYVLEVSRDRLSPAGVEKLVRAKADRDGRMGTAIWIEQEPGSSGVNTVHTYRKLLLGFNFRGDRPTGNKVERARSASAACENGLVYIVRGSKTVDFINELQAFPLGGHDDMVDAFCGSFNKIAESSTIGRKNSRIRKNKRSIWG